VKGRDIRIEEGLGELTWGPAKVTMLLDRSHISALRKISAVTRIPMSKIAGQALDEFLAKVGWQEEPTNAPTDPQFIAKRIAQARKAEEAGAK